MTSSSGKHLDIFLGLCASVTQPFPTQHNHILIWNVLVISRIHHPIDLHKSPWTTSHKTAPKHEWSNPIFYTGATQSAKHVSDVYEQKFYFCVIWLQYRKPILVLMTPQQSSAVAVCEIFSGGASCITSNQLALIRVPVSDMWKFWYAPN